MEKLLGALGVLWRENPHERMVVFATYLGSVEMLGAEIDQQYPAQGVTVLKGGDHGAKVAAEKRFKSPDGPKVLICTAAGREGINLQHARILFNFDLPWNPMDLEQRIGRIHRYGQRNTAQVYNLVLSDTIEGSIFLLLDQKLAEIGRALGKVDEDLRTQILGQLSLQLNYASLYADALSDPQLKRTRVELEAAMSNAVEARKVVFELFQDLDGFRLDDYKAMGSPEEAMSALARFLADVARAEGETFASRSEKLFAWINREAQTELLLTTERELSLQKENIQLLGLDHPLITAYLRRYRALPPEEIGIRVQSGANGKGVLAVGAVEARGDKGQVKRAIVTLAVDEDGKRQMAWERRPEKLWQAQPAAQNGNHRDAKLALMRDGLEPMLQRELEHHYPNSKALAWVRDRGNGSITFWPEPVDACRVPAELAGFRTVFTAFHHFRPEQARAVLADTVHKGEGIGLFECGQHSVALMVFAALATPVRVLLWTPFIRPFRWSRFFWTYLVPAVPLVLMFDTVMSCLRVYSVDELRDLTRGLDCYDWEIGTVWPQMPPTPNTYLVGVPAAPKKELAQIGPELQIKLESTRDRSFS